MNKPLVTAIIPVYNVSLYLERCIVSIVHQRYSNIEIILVDDGSPDECALMCDEWAEKDDRITVIHKLNGGQAEARNYGMQFVCGEYISFIDSDDYISDDFIEVLLSTAIEHGSDIAVCDFTKCYENGEYKEYHDDFLICNFPDSEGMIALLNGNVSHIHVWYKLYRLKADKDLDFL